MITTVKPGFTVKMEFGRAPKMYNESWGGGGIINLDHGWPDQLENRYRYRVTCEEQDGGISCLFYLLFVFYIINFMTSYANFRTIMVTIVVSAFEYSTCSVFCYLLVKYN